VPIQGNGQRNRNKYSLKSKKNICPRKSLKVHKTGQMGNGLATERIEDVMTDPDDYFLVPPRNEPNKFISGGDIWEIVEQ